MERDNRGRHWDSQRQSLAFPEREKRLWMVELGTLVGWWSFLVLSGEGEAILYRFDGDGEETRCWWGQILKAGAGDGSPVLKDIPTATPS